MPLPAVSSDDTEAYGAQNHGLVVVGPWLSGFAWLPSHVVVPKDSNGDGAPDTWFEDANSDGVNDLLKVISKPSENYTDSIGWDYWQ